MNLNNFMRYQGYGVPSLGYWIAGISSNPTSLERHPTPINPFTLEVWVIDGSTYYISEDIPSPAQL